MTAEPNEKVWSTGRPGRRAVARMAAAAGTAPGTLAVPPGARPTGVIAVSYDADAYDEHELTGLEEAARLRDSDAVLWLQVEGYADLERIQDLGAIFELHPLALEDVLRGSSAPKFEDYDSNAFIVLRWPAEERGPDRQINLFFGQGWVVTFSAGATACLDPVRERLRAGRRRIRSYGADYLAYALVDAIVDSYFPVLERYTSELDRLETETLEDPDPNVIKALHGIRRDLSGLRRSAAATREAVAGFQRADTTIQEMTRLYARDCYDHTQRLIDLLGSYRDQAASLMEVYLAHVSYRVGEITKVLTIIATVFIPLTFVAGIYGMNFRGEKSPWNMPELGWYFGYPFALGLMAVIGAALVLYFYRKGWLGKRR